ncbi:protein translocase subunit SecF [Amnibacterium kyonggiense]|uniref:Protein-export membrane protein SecF n=1 Tax=Amnibacterium kyonggiense TaxID=595671 RepID=A0A4R7FM51_9MICO|nr:protein translocase subunit SecF [Amnibacterium kyonggiense]TDS77483.1 protein translocase subunit secF [Amnibacterium kyonggiense]
MAGGLTSFGNDLYTGARSIDFIKRRRVWYVVSGVAVVLALVLPLLVLPAFGHGFRFGIEFTGGSQFTVNGSTKDIQNTNLAKAAVQSVTGTEVEPGVAVVGTNGVRVQTTQLDTDGSTTRSDRVAAALGKAYDVPVPGNATRGVSSSFVGPTWGQDISAGAIRGLIIFLVLVAIVMAVYFRTWKMSVAGIVSLVHDLIITAGVYGIVGFEITPAAVIGFLTILGYSLYDTVVVFDKIRENTSQLSDRSTRTFAETVNLAVNQTLVRSINTSIVGLLPIASILFIGTTLLGAGTLRDISLALFIGIIVGTYSTIFVAAPLYTDLRSTEPAIKLQTRRVLDARRNQAVEAPVRA